MLRRLNEALPGLILGILLYGVLLQLTGVWFVEDKLMYSTGLWIGIILAMGMAVHMAIVIEDAVSTGSGQGKVTALSIFRYVITVLVFIAVIYFHLGNPIVTFIGVMGLKIAAYGQPLINKVLLKLWRREEYPTKDGLE